MKGRAYIAWLRSFSPEMLFYQRLLCRHEALLLADAAEIADEAAADLIERESLRAGDWWDTRYAINGLGDYNEVDECDPINKALSYLDRRGLIERKEGEPHLVRFVKEA